MVRITLPLGEDMIAEIDSHLGPNETRVGFIRHAIAAQLDYRNNANGREAAE